VSFVISSERPVITRSAPALLLGAVVSGFDGGSIGFLLPAVRADLGIAAAPASWLVALYVAGTLAAVPIAGALVRRFGDAVLFRVCAAIAAVAAVAAAAAPGSDLLLLARLAQGVGQGPVLPLAAAIVSARWPMARQGRMHAALSLAYGVGFLGGMLAAPMLLQWGWRLVFGVAAVLPAAALAFPLPSGSATYPRAAVPRRRQLAVIAVLALGTGVGQAVVVYLPTLAVERLAVTPSAAGWLMAPLVVGGIVGTLAIAAWLDAVGARHILVWGAIGTVGGVLLAAAAPPSPAAFLAGAAALGLGITGLCGGPLRYAAARAAPVAEQGLAQSMVALATNVGLLGGSLLLGAFATAGAARAVVVACALMALLFVPVFTLPAHDRLSAS
jgi:MFS family permease